MKNLNLVIGLGLIGIFILEYKIQNHPQTNEHQNFVKACEVIRGHTFGFNSRSQNPSLGYIEDSSETEVCSQVKSEVDQYFKTWKPNGIDDQPFGTICNLCGPEGHTGSIK